MQISYQLFVDGTPMGKPNQVLEAIKSLAVDFISKDKNCHIEVNRSPAPSWALRWDYEVKSWVNTALPILNEE